jgi:hypothetical protein
VFGLRFGAGLRHGRCRPQGVVVAVASVVVAAVVVSAVVVASVVVAPVVGCVSVVACAVVVPGTVVVGIVERPVGTVCRRVLVDAVDVETVVAVDGAVAVLPPPPVPGSVLPVGSLRVTGALDVSGVARTATAAPASATTARPAPAAT